MELWHAFDRIRAALLKQEQMRGAPEFGRWLVKALPAYVKYVDFVDEQEQESYGRVLCSWGDWLEARKLSWRGKQTWEIPTEGPLTFTPPSTAGLLSRAGELLVQMNLAAAVVRSGRCGSGPTQETRGGSGRKRMARSLTVRK